MSKGGGNSHQRKVHRTAEGKSATPRTEVARPQMPDVAPAALEERNIQQRLLDFIEQPLFILAAGVVCLSLRLASFWGSLRSRSTGRFLSCAECF